MCNSTPRKHDDAANNTRDYYAHSFSSTSRFGDEKEQGKSVKRISLARPDLDSERGDYM